MYRSSPNRPRGRVRAFLVGAVALLSLFLTASAWAQIVVNPGSLPAATVNSSYSQTFTGSGGVAPYSFYYTGTLPVGISLSSTGVLSGVATEAGTFNITLVATDSTAAMGGQPYLLVVNPPTTIINPVALSNPTVGVPYSESITASGGIAPYFFHVSGGSFPPGLTLSSSGSLTGMPTAGGSYTFTVSANGSSTGAGAPHSGSRTYAISISAGTVTLPVTTLSDATQGAPYTAVINGATGGTAPYTYHVASGALPPGITFAGNGVLSGNPTLSGDYTFYAVATDSSTGTGPYSSAARAYSVRVNGGTPPTAANVSATVAYSSSNNPIPLSIVGSPATSVLVGTPPVRGIATASGTTISYTPNVGFAGPDSFTYIARNAAGDSAPATATITVSNPTISVSASAPFTAQVGVPYAQTFSWNGGSLPYSSYQVLGLPAGLNVTGTGMNSVTISGIPTATGSFNVTASAADSSTGIGPFITSQGYTLSVSAPTLTLTPAAGTLSANYGVAYSQTYVAGGGTPNYTYAISAGALPAGLSLDASTGVLSGVPTVTGLYTFSVRARDNSTGTGAPFARTQNYVMQVSAPTITVNPAVLSGATAGVPTSQQLSASGGIGPYTYAASGTFPNGIVLNSTGLLSGTAVGAGTYNFDVTATDANGQSGSRPYVLTVAPPALSIQPSALSNATAGAPYSQTLSTSGGISPYSYSITSGLLPPGIALSPSGVISGTPPVAINETFTVTATDSEGASASRAYTLVVNPSNLTLSSSATLDGTAGVFQTATITASGGVGTYT